MTMSMTFEEAPEAPSLMKKLRGPMMTALIVFLIFFGGFGTWAALVPIASGAIATGTISPDGSRRTVQHLEGGIIAELFVRDGDEVEVGAPLLVLEKTQAQVGEDVLAERQRTLQATVARLQAEQQNASQITWPEALAASTEPDVMAMRDAQDALFRNRRQSRGATRDAIRSQISQLEAEIDGITSLIESQDQQLALLQSEIATVNELFREGLAPEGRLLDLRRQLAQSMGSRAENVAKVARARQTIGEKNVEMVNVGAGFQADVAQELDTARTELSSVTSEKSAATDRLSRTVVSAPVPGRVANLNFKTLGGVIRPGDSILDIVPTEEELLIEARVSPVDIDAIRVGLDANVQLSAFTSRNLPRIGGRVRSISADAIMDEVTGQPYFRVNVEVDTAKLEELERTLNTQLTLAPGMPAEVLIVTGERTLLQYLWEPLQSSIQQAFREQ